MVPSVQLEWKVTLSESRETYSMHKSKIMDSILVRGDNLELDKCLNDGFLSYSNSHFSIHKKLG